MKVYFSRLYQPMQIPGVQTGFGNNACMYARYFALVATILKKSFHSVYLQNDMVEFFQEVIY